MQRSRLRWILLTLVVVVSVLIGCKVGAREKTILLPSVLFGAEETPPSRPAPTGVQEAPGPLILEGFHDGAEKILTQSSCRAFGWVIDLSDSERDVEVRVLADGAVVAQSVAGLYRPDLELNQMCPAGTCAFAVDLASLVSPDEEHTVLVQARDAVRDQWVDVEGSPKKLTCMQPETAAQPGG